MAIAFSNNCDNAFRLPPLFICNLVISTSLLIFPQVSSTVLPQDKLCMSQGVPVFVTYCNGPLAQDWWMFATP